MRVLLISGMSGSGKSVALRVLEDAGYYVIDNLPASFVPAIVADLQSAGQRQIAIGIDIRGGNESITALPALIPDLRQGGHDVRVVFLTADTPTLVARYSETRRRHPLSTPDGQRTLEECIEAERQLLAPLDAIGHLIDTSHLRPQILRNWILDFIASERTGLTLSFQSFAYKQGVPMDADLVFDVRCLPNPFYEPGLRPLNGRDSAVIAYLRAIPDATHMVRDIGNFLASWLPAYRRDNRNYLTVAIGCTGGQHRSVFVAEELATRFRAQEHVLVRHRALERHIEN